MNPNPVSRYPSFNDPPYAERPILSVYDRIPLGELAWLVVPAAVLALAMLLR